MKLIVLIALTSLLSMQSRSQYNLLSNGDFESFPAAWYTIKTVDHSTGTPWIGPFSVNPVDGNHLIGLRFYHAWPDWQEYVWQDIDTLTPGHTYQVRIWIHHAWNSQNTTNDIGISIINNEFGLYDTDPEFAIKNEQPEIKMEKVVTEREWTLLSGEYIGQGNEVALAIGCFKTDATLNMVPIQAVTAYADAMQDVYFYVDDANLVECNEAPNPIEDIIICQQDSITIDASWPETNYTWEDGSTDSTFTFFPKLRDTVFLRRSVKGCFYDEQILVKVFSGPSDPIEDVFVCSDDDFPVKFATNAFPDEQISWSEGTVGTQVFIYEDDSYTLTKSLGQCSWTDTFEVTSGASILNMYPNPGKDEYTGMESSDISIIKILDERGRILNNDRLTGSAIGEALQVLDPAMYLITLEYEGCQRTVKFVKEQ